MLPVLLVLALAHFSTLPPWHAGTFSTLGTPGTVGTQAPSKERLREDTVTSAALGKAMRYRVLVPENYAASQRRYPVLYLLHGLNGDYMDWTTRTNLAEYSRALPLIIVMPDGTNSWYTNSPADGGGRFEDYVLEDVVKDVESKYRAIRSRHGRAIAGLSMGGYGALKMALRRPGQFAFAGGFSGALAVARDPEFGSSLGAEFDRMKTIFGPADSQTRRDNDLFALAAAVRPAAAPYLYVDCGTSDSLLESNRELAAVFRKTGLAYEYHELPGAHTWEYWDTRVQQMLSVLMTKFSR